MINCPKCNNNIPDTAIFCGHCGYKFEKPVSSTSLQSAPSRETDPQPVSVQPPVLKEAKESTRSWGRGLLIVVFLVLGGFGTIVAFPGIVGLTRTDSQSASSLPAQAQIFDDAQWEVVFTDDFSNLSNTAWTDIRDEERIKIYFDASALRFDIFDNGGFMSQNETSIYQNIRVSAEVQVLNGSGDFGVLCRKQVDQYAMYSFMVGTDGGFRIWKIRPQTASFLTSGNDARILAAFESPPVLIVAECIGSELGL